MAIKVKFKMPNFDKYLEAIQAAGRDLDAAADKAIMAGAQILYDKEQELVPKDTRNLERHIRIKGPIQEGSHHIVEVGIIRDRALTDKDTMRYAIAEEFGSAHAKAQPYIRPAKDLVGKKVMAAIRKSLKESGKI